MDKRKFLIVLGGGVVVAAGAGVAGFVTTRTPASALAPWFEAGSLYDEPRRKALSYAILAPNPHNRQPWLVELSQENTITLFVDQEKLLPHTDPFNRQIVIGLGCFLEILRMAAAEDGYRASIEYFPDGADQNGLDERPVAVIRFLADANIVRDPLFVHVLNRRSLKEPYDPEHEVDDEILRELAGVVQTDVIVGTTNFSERIAELRKLTGDALMIELETDRTYKESVDLFRIGKSEVEANPDGIDLSGPLFETLAITGIFTRESAFDRSSTMYAQAVSAVMANVNSAMAYVWLTSAQNTRMDQLNAGMDYVRVNLAAAGAGVGIHPLSQALQEFEEMQGPYQRCKELLAPAGGTVQMLARLGYAPAADLTPRWQLEEKIIRG